DVVLVAHAEPGWRRPFARIRRLDLEGRDRLGSALLAQTHEEELLATLARGVAGDHEVPAHGGDRARAGGGPHPAPGIHDYAGATLGLDVACDLGCAGHPVERIRSLEVPERILGVVRERLLHVAELGGRTVRGRR